MLQVEDRLNDFDGVLLSPYQWGTAYQLSGALKKIGKKVLGLNEKNLNELEIQNETLLWGFQILTPKDLREASTIHYYSHFISFLNQVSEENVLDEQIENLKKTLSFVQRNNPKTKIIIVADGNLYKDLKVKLEHILKLLHHVVLYVPTSYGLNDHSLLDFFIETYHEAKFEDFTADEKAPLIWSADLASFIISILYRFPVESKELYLPLKEVVLNEFLKTAQKEFSKYHQDNTDLKSLLKSFFKRRKLIPIKIADYNQEFLKQECQSFFDVYPEILTGLEKSIRKSREHLEANKDLKSHFLPGKAL